MDSSSTDFRPAYALVSKKKRQKMARACVSNSTSPAVRSFSQSRAPTSNASQVVKPTDVPTVVSLPGNTKLPGHNNETCFDTDTATVHNNATRDSECVSNSWCLGSEADSSTTADHLQKITDCDDDEDVTVMISRLHTLVRKKRSGVWIMENEDTKKLKHDNICKIMKGKTNAIENNVRSARIPENVVTDKNCPGQSSKRLHGNESRCITGSIDHNVICSESDCTVEYVDNPLESGASKVGADGVAVSTNLISSSQQSTQKYNLLRNNSNSELHKSDHSNLLDRQSGPESTDYLSQNSRGSTRKQVYSIKECVFSSQGSAHSTQKSVHFTRGSVHSAQGVDFSSDHNEKSTAVTKDQYNMFHQPDNRDSSAISIANIVGSSSTNLSDVSKFLSKTNNFDPNGKSCVVAQVASNFAGYQGLERDFGQCAAGTAVDSHGPPNNDNSLGDDRDGVSVHGNHQQSDENHMSVTQSHSFSNMGAVNLSRDEAESDNTSGSHQQNSCSNNRNSQSQDQESNSIVDPNSGAPHVFVSTHLLTIHDHIDKPDAVAHLVSTQLCEIVG